MVQFFFSHYTVIYVYFIMIKKTLSIASLSNIYCGNIAKIPHQVTESGVFTGLVSL